MIIFTLEHNQDGSCSIAIDFKNRKFQPSIEIKGTIARTYLYIADKYGITLSESEKINERMESAYSSNPKRVPPSRADRKTSR